MLRPEPEGVRQALEYQVAVLAPVPAPAQRGERERVRGLVREMERLSSERTVRESAR